MRKCVVIANGPIEDIKIFESLLRDADTIICADGGLNHLEAIGIKPDVVLGDFDSIDLALKTRYEQMSVTFHTFPKRKDATDSELAIDYAVKTEPGEIFLLGMTGKRLDHGLTNLHLLKRIPKEIKACILDNYNKIYYCESDFHYRGEIGENLSIIPISDEVTGIITEGLDYPLKDETLRFDSSRGVSNVLSETEIKIETTAGTYFVIIAKD